MARPAARRGSRGVERAAGPEPYWRSTPLESMTAEQWDALCARCGRCCLVKLEDDDTGSVLVTDVCCDHLDVATGRCTCYGERLEVDPECIRLDPELASTAGWLPETCAYRLVARGRDLPPWHPLVSGDPGSVRRAGLSVAGRVVPEALVDDDDLEDHIVDETW